MRIGPYTFANPWILAPMAGASEMPFRVIARRLGAAAAPTELVSCKGLVYGQARTTRYLAHHESEQPFWVQLFGGEPASMADGAARAADLGAEIIDVNMGCPVRKVTKAGAGSALMQDPDRAARIVEAIAARTGLPVTAKIRSGWDSHTVNAIEVTRRLAGAGCCAIAIHARTRTQGYSGTADWELIARLVLSSPIPVIGNGDVFSAADARRLRATTGCAAVMVGRGALGNPWIFEQLAAPGAEPPTPEQRWAVVREHLAAHIAFVGDERRAVRRFRQHAMWYAHGLRDAAAFRRRILNLVTAADVAAACERFFLRAERSESAGGPMDAGAALG